MNTLSRQARRFRFALVATLGLLVLGLVIGARPALAQISTGAESFTHPVPRKPGQALIIPPSQTYLGISPLLTSFQQQQTTRQGNTDPHPGEVDTKKRTHVGPTLLVEKLFFLRPAHGNDYSTFTLGTWYWYSRFNRTNGIGQDNDRFSVYTKYFYDSRIGAQLSAGGGTRSGFYEYYLFGLYNLKNGSKKSPLGIQVGLGPYIPRSSYGDVGYTGVLNLSLPPKKPTDKISYSASVWYVQFKQPVGGANFKKDNNTLRLNFNINYRL